MSGSGCRPPAASCPRARRACSPGTTRRGLFAMEYLEHPVWKSLLAAGRADPAFAALAGAALAAIHAATAGSADLARRFPTDAIFHAIRLEPYLVATSASHADLRERLLGL